MMSGYRGKVPGLSSSSEDSDDDDMPVKRMKVKSSSMDITPEQETLPANSLQVREGVTTLSEKTRKRNNIWSAVIAEETLTSELVDVGVRNKTMFKERDVESYDYTVAYEMRHDTADNDVLNLHPCDEEMERDEDIFGGAPNEDELTRVSAKKRLGSRAEGDKAESISDITSIKSRLGPSKMELDSKNDPDDEKEKKSMRERLGSFESKASVKDRLGKEDSESHRRHRRARSRKPNLGSNDNKIPVDEAALSRRRERFGDVTTPEKLEQSKYVEITPEDSIPTIVNGLSSNLQEPKIDLLHNIVKLVGPRKAIDLMHETEMIEESGGLLINDGSRRRTPGGVFLFLLRNDKAVPKDELNALMSQDRIHFSGRNKRSRKRKHECPKQDDFAKLLNEHKEVRKCAERPHPPSPNSDSNPTVDPYPHKINMDNELSLDDDGPEGQDKVSGRSLVKARSDLDEESSHAMCAEDVTLPTNSRVAGSDEAVSTMCLEEVSLPSDGVKSQMNSSGDAQHTVEASNKSMELEDGELEDGEVSD